MTERKAPNRHHAVAGEMRVQMLAHATGLALPAYQTQGAAGLDLVAAVAPDKPLTLAPRQRLLVPTGLVIELPAGYEAQVRPRSGLANKHGITVLNSPGTIDSDYRGEVQVLLINLGTEPFEIRRGERIAQLVVAPVIQVQLTAVEDVSRTARGAGGFGSTGTASPRPTPSGRSRSKSKAVPKPATAAQHRRGDKGTPRTPRKG